MSAAGGSGTRARSRELGAAGAWRDIFHLLDSEAATWKNLAERQLDPTAHAIAEALSVRLDKLRDYAHGASIIHELPDIGEFLTDTVWDPRFGGAAPAELPQRENPESN